ncbi:MAG: PhzF family phenazine biosynthesis protein [Thermomicrobiales bacterium]
MSRWDYHILDVFSSQPLAGNQLAVFEDAVAIPEELLQPLAREIGFSETVFLFPSSAGNDADIRIFTPTGEVPFAGHPTLGAAVVVAGRAGRDAVLLGTGRGAIPVQLAAGPDRSRRGSMSQPIPTVAVTRQAEAILAAIGVERSELPLVTYDNGIRHIYIVLASPDEVAAVRPRFTDLAEIARGSGSGFATFSVLAGSGRHWKTRVFTPTDPSPEDAATGSAAGPLALHLARHGLIDWGDEITISQGAEIGRPSELLARVSLAENVVGSIEVTGDAVIVGGGWFDAALIGSRLT